MPVHRDRLHADNVPGRQLNYASGGSV